ncbi:MAG: YrbL family protein [Candidatus Margulisbacteria bacterium]|nr:YrbL family protein [Candidatus Margulisiibacteriota bacterium]
MSELVTDENCQISDIQPENILVQQLADGRLYPKLMDYKRLGAKTYPTQFWLHWSSNLLAKKLERKFQRLRDNFS